MIKYLPGLINIVGRKYVPPIIPEFLIGGSLILQVPSPNEYIITKRLIVSSGCTASITISYLVNVMLHITKRIKFL